jgi:hypothetical protein
LLSKMVRISTLEVKHESFFFFPKLCKRVFQQAGPFFSTHLFMTGIFPLKDQICVHIAI